MDSYKKEDIMLGVIRDGQSRECICHIESERDIIALRNALIVFAMKSEIFYEAMIDVAKAIMVDEDLLRGQVLRMQVEGDLEKIDD